MKRMITLLLCGTFLMPLLANAQYGDPYASYPLIFLIVFIITLVLLHWIIASATRSAKRQKELIRQSHYLKAIAKKLDVTPEIIAEIEAIYKKS